MSGYGTAEFHCVVIALFNPRYYICYTLVPWVADFDYENTTYQEI